MIPIDFTIDGVTYQVSRLTQELQDAFGRWCENHAWQILRQSRQQCDDREYNLLLLHHQAMKRHESFEFGGPEAVAYLTTKEGYRQFMFLAFRKFQGVTPEQVTAIMEAHPEDCLRLFEEIMETKKKTESDQDAAAGDGLDRNVAGGRQPTL